MADIERISAQAAGGMTVLLARVRSLALVVALIAGLIGLLTFATGWWVFDGSTGWLVVGGAVCFAPAVAALIGVMFVHGAAVAAPNLLHDIGTFLGGRRGGDEASNVLIDLDSGVALTTQSRSFTGMRSELGSRKAELPALWLAVRAIAAVPKLAAFTVLGMFGVGFLGFVLLIVGLID